MPKRMELLALVALVTLMIVMATLTPEDDRGTWADKQPRTALHSIYSNRPNGYKALYLTLERLGYPVHRQIRPYGMLPQRGVLIVGDAYAMRATRYEGRELQTWLRRGNYALILLEHHPDFLDDLQHNNTAQLAPVASPRAPSKQGHSSIKAPKIPTSIAQPMRWSNQQGQREFPFAELPPLTITSTRRFRKPVQRQPGSVCREHGSRSMPTPKVWWRAMRPSAGAASSSAAAPGQCLIKGSMREKISILSLRSWRNAPGGL